MSQGSLEEGTDSSIENIGRKILYCPGCEVAADSVHEITNERGKSVQLCVHCGERLVMRAEDRIKSSLTGKPIGDMESKRSWATRLFTTPWGKLKMHISTQSFFAPFVELNGEKCPAIKRLIDEAFGDDAVASFLVEIKGGTPYESTSFIFTLEDIVREIHTNPDTPVNIDYDLESV